MKHRARYVLTMVLSLWLLGLYGQKAPATDAPAFRQVTIIYTSDMTAALEACG